MTRFSLPALACACALVFAAAAARADDAKLAAKKGDATERILEAMEQEVEFKEGSHINDIPLVELLAHFSKGHNVTFIIMEEYFNAEGVPNIQEAKPRLQATQLRGLRLHQFLRAVLGSMGATYLVKSSSIEIVPVRYAAKVTKSPLLQGGGARLAEPLVSAVFKEKPLSEAVATIAETFDLTVTVSPQAGDARKEPASARLLNVPAEKALELLALQADLRLVRRGSAYLITSKEQANEIFDEELNKQRQQIELKRLREEKPAGFNPLVPGARPLDHFRNLPPFDGFHVPGNLLPSAPPQNGTPARPKK